VSIVTVPVPSPFGPLDVTIASPSHPQVLTGVLWRYKPDQTPDGVAGTFTPASPTAPIGNPTDNDGKFFMIEGAVLHQNDNPPTAYEVVVTVRHNGVAIHVDVPSDGGTGTIGSADVRFAYTFQIKVA
jgi:hypothetical protein